MMQSFYVNEWTQSTLFCNDNHLSLDWLLHLEENSDIRVRWPTIRPRFSGTVLIFNDVFRKKKTNHSSPGTPIYPVFGLVSWICPDFPSLQPYAYASVSMLQDIYHARQTAGFSRHRLDTASGNNASIPCHLRWHSGATGRALDVWSIGHGFKSYSGQKLHNNLGQVVHTYVPPSPSSITWYRPRGSDALRLGR